MVVYKSNTLMRNTVMGKKAWVVLSDYNDYNQYGTYFIAWFSTKPTIKQLRALNLTSHEDVLENLLLGGGRLHSEDVWYYLREVEEGSTTN